MRHVLTFLSRYWWIAPILMLVGNLYRYREDFFPGIFPPEKNPYSSDLLSDSVQSPTINPLGYTKVTVSPAQYVLACQEQAYFDAIVAGPTEEAQRNIYASMLVPGVDSPSRCDYLARNGNRVLVQEPLDLVFLREAFVIPADPTLGALEGAELSVRMYRIMLAGEPYYVLLAHPKINGVYQDWASDILTLAYGK